MAYYLSLVTDEVEQQVEQEEGRHSLLPVTGYRGG